ncbi:hypothetical protein N9U07_00385 [bacterium]|nr:hypothetical protein [bacterium]
MNDSASIPCNGEAFQDEKNTHELFHHFGCHPSRLELAHAMGIKFRDLEELIVHSDYCCSIDTHVRGEENCGTLEDLIPDATRDEPMEKMYPSIQNEYRGGWLSQFTECDQQILSLRFGLGGEEPLTLVAIGCQINVSCERVRQLE